MDQKTHIVHFKVSAFPIPDILKRLGYPSGNYEMKEPMKSIFHEELARAGSLLEPRGIFRLLAITERDETHVQCGNRLTIDSRQVSRLLRNSAWAALFYVTLGSRLEEASHQLGVEGELTRSLFLDAIGSETADALADRMHREYIKAKFGKKGLAVTARFSPGYGDWPLTVQKKLWETCRAGSIGIEVNESFLMIPRKSVSAIFGLVPGTRDDA